MPKKLFVLVAIIMIATLALTACQPGASSTKLKICQVTDTGGIDDKGFNQTAWKGISDAMKSLGVDGKYLESKQQTDYEKNLNAFVEEKCDLIIPVGFMLGDATKKIAEANPNQKFAGIDISYDPPLNNVVGTNFNVDEPSYMAGYLAAGVTKTGKVGTYGGIQIPPLEPFMTGFYNGVKAYNEKNGTKVEVLGWDPATKTGLFTGNFTSTDDGRRMAETLMDEGADVVFPVAGPCGLGSAAAIKERGGAVMIGVDTDQYVSAPEYKSIMLTSVLKNMDKVVTDIIKTVKDGTYKGGTYVGTISNGGVGLSSFHDLESMVTDQMKKDLDQIKKDIMDGKIKPMQ